MNVIKPEPSHIYHANTEAWSRSMLSTFRESKREAYLRYVEKSGPEDNGTQSMKLGSLAHAMLLEPSKVDSQFVVIPSELLASNGAISTKAAKAFVEENEAQGITVIKQGEYDASKRITDSVKTVCGKWLDKATQIEHSCYWKDEITGLQLKARPDFVVRTPSDVFIIDLKTTGRVVPYAVTKAMEDFEYWLQCCHYRQGESVVNGSTPQMIFVCVENKWPHRAAAFQLCKDTKAKSFEVWRYLVNDVAKAIETNSWADAWENQITELTLKDYVFRGNQ